LNPEGKASFTIELVPQNKPTIKGLNLEKTLNNICWFLNNSIHFFKLSTESHQKNKKFSPRTPEIV